jgi:hypothetical protein
MLLWQKFPCCYALAVEASTAIEEPTTTLEQQEANAGEYFSSNMAK